MPDHPQVASKYVQGKVIGCGQFGRVRLMHRMADGVLVCRKEQNFVIEDKQYENVANEFKIISSIKNEHIVEYIEHDYRPEEKELHLYMEYCGNGDLNKKIAAVKAAGEMFPEPFIWSVFSQLSDALFACHNGVPTPAPFLPGIENQAAPFPANPAIKIIHRDLKPDNVFLGDSHTVKLGDFGLSKIMDKSQFTKTHVGTPYYLSPELLAGRGYSCKTDIWSLGCIIYELCCLRTPFQREGLTNHEQLYRVIKSGSYNDIPGTYSSELRSAIRACLQVDPNQRTNAAQLLGVPQIKSARQSRYLKKYSEELKVLDASVTKKQMEVHHMKQTIEDRIAKERVDIEAKANAYIESRVAEARATLSAQFDIAVAVAVENKVRELDLVPRSNLQNNQTPSRYGPASQNLTPMRMDGSPMDVMMRSPEPSVFGGCSTMHTRDPLQPVIGSSFNTSAISTVSSNASSTIVGASFNGDGSDDSGLGLADENSALSINSNGWRPSQSSLNQQEFALSQDAQHIGTTVLPSGSPAPKPLRRSGGLQRAQSDLSQVTGGLSSMRAQATTRGLAMMDINSRQTMRQPAPIWDLSKDEAPSPFLRKTRH